MPTIKLSDTEVLQVIHHCNNLDMVKHLADKLKASINNKGKEEVNEVTEAQLRQRDGHTRQRVANALGMNWGANISTDDIVKFINDNVTKDAAQTIKELHRDLEKEVDVSKYLRSCLQEIGQALNQTNLTPASVTESALVYIKEKESTEHSDTYKVRAIRYAMAHMSGQTYQNILHHIKDIVDQNISTGPVKDDLGRMLVEASGLSMSDGVQTMISVMRYRRDVTEVADAIARGSEMLTAEYLRAQDVALKEAQRKLSDITDIFNERSRSASNSDWARIGEILG